MDRYCTAAMLPALVLFFVSVVSSACPPPPEQPGTNCSDATVVNFMVDYVITCKCRFGYVRVGDATRRCTENGTWTGSDQICRIDAASLALACFAGLSAILIFTFLSCWLLSRNRSKRSREERHLAVQRRQAEGANGGSDGAVEPDMYTRVPSTKDRSDSGLQTDLDLDDINLDNFCMEVDSPTENSAPEGRGLGLIEE